MDNTRVHLVGIGGDGMVPLAELLWELGAEITGSDLVEGRGIRELRERGISVCLGHREENVWGAETVIFSSAVPHHNPELSGARRSGAEVLPRLLALGRLLSRKRLIAVCGTHGKTTTTAWIAHLLRPWDVGFYVGAEVRGLPRARWGASPWFVAEVDESDGLFLGLFPEVAVLTNVDRDHLSSYGNFVRLKASFSAFLAKAASVVVCADDPVSLEASRGHGQRFTYGLSAGADLSARDVHIGPEGTIFSVYLSGNRLGETMIPAFGIHNVRNALAALAAGHVIGASLRELLGKLPSLPLPARRLEVVVENGYVLVDDYAHHPREIAAGIAAARARWPKRRVRVLFQPHRFSRTAFLHRELGEVLARADYAVVTEIYPAFEVPVPGVSGELVFRAMRGYGGRGAFVSQPVRAVEALLEISSPGDVLVCFGAGDLWKHFREIPKML
jgi:UDP-N-acetylmuramate--alanine ligase